MVVLGGFAWNGPTLPSGLRTVTTCHDSLQPDYGELIRIYPYGISLLFNNLFQHIAAGFGRARTTTDDPGPLQTADQTRRGAITGRDLVVAGGQRA